MKPETEARLKKIKRVSNFLRAICKVALALVTCVFLVATVAILAGWGTLSAFDDSIVLAPLALSYRQVLAAVFALAMAVNLKGLYHLYRLLGNYGAGNIFTTESANQIRQLGITALLWFGVNVLWAIARIRMIHSPIQTVQFHSDSLVTGVVIIVISWFMEMAAEMREENELTI